MHALLPLPNTSVLDAKGFFHMTVYACMDGACATCGGLQASEGWLLTYESGRARQRARAFVQRILEFEFDTLVPAHFLAPVPDGKAALAEAFKFLL